MKRILYTFVLLIPLFCKAQKQGNIWYFGDHAGVDFSEETPSALTDGHTYLKNGHSEGTSVISDSNGSLLFYTNGEKIWNKNHEIMMNGDSLLSSSSSTQSSLIVPKPGNNNTFYLFTTDAFYIDNLQYGLRYSVLDLCLDNGLGGVISNQKNILLLDTVAEKLTATKHANGIDYWIVTHKYYSDAFYAYLLTANGITDTIVSHIGTIHRDNCGTQSTSAAIGYMKISPDGSRIAVACGNTCDNVKEVFDFDATTGFVLNFIDLNLQVDTFGTYGVAFSPDNSKLYLTDMGDGQIYQYDLLAGGGQPDSIRVSKIKISNLNQSTGDLALALQLGLDGKIYVARLNRSFLAIINNPTERGLGCDFQDNAISLNGKICSYGLPNFIDDYEYSNTIVNCEVGINNIGNNNSSIKTCPNPAQQSFTITLPQQQNFNLLVYDVTGRKVFQRTNSTGIVTIDCSNFTSGVYFVQASNDKIILTSKLVKE